MASCIVYYSLSGNTEYAAKYLGDKLGAEVFGVEESEKRKGVFGFIKSGFQAVSGQPALISPDSFGYVEDFDTVWLLSPIWAGNANPAMNAFLDGAKLSDKTVHIVTFQADPDAGSAPKVHEYLSKRVAEKGGRVGRTWALHSASPGKFAGEEALSSQIDTVLSEFRAS